ncbi:TMV resistance protein N-like [Rosa rugosa]|uniref:TMV resistance protein N-like n=1 Tax=Rosa rugosa TaxID=74645 RepID=UPI002B403491|nr:TMV resistance protein N-like [Rosa rugosa]
MAIQLRASSSSLSSASSTGSWRHDVFLSFRGEDTRDNFTGHLHRYLVHRGINTFIDDDLRRGEEISEALLQAIEESKLSLVVFSENYASSKWCLNELLHILECKRSNNQMVGPIFYKVDPSDVRNQRGRFGEALAQHERRFQEVSRWRAALSEAANLSGWHFSGTGNESKFINRIVKEVYAQLTEVKEPTYLDMPNCQVGLHSRVKHILEMLDVEGSDVRMVGIWGIGGIGKTTIAKAVYNTIAHKFDGSCFLANVREYSEQHGGLVDLQNTLLSTIVRQKELKINNVHEGNTLLHKMLSYKRILLVLDDVNKLAQLRALAGASDWFGRGSKIIITTRDKRLLTVHNVNLYEARELDHHEGSKLFSSNAFKHKTNLDDNEKLLVSTVVDFTRGLPLALVILGLHLYDRPVKKWQAMLDGFKRDLPEGIQDILKVSYDGLKETEKEVFLDIACFFKGRNTEDVIQILEGCDRIDAMLSIEVLKEKALINVSKFGFISMHDLLEEMGKGIVNKESKDPGKRSRLWYHHDVVQVLTKNTGTGNIEGIMVKMPIEDEIHLSPKCFKRMKNLKIFININGRFCGKVVHLPDQLRLLDWPKCPLKYFPSNFDTKKMVHFSMPGSRISTLGERFKSMQNLKSLNLKECESLAQIPDLSGSPNLEFLNLSGCKRLEEVHSSVGSLERLIKLNLGGCSKLVMLPEKVNWRSLETINLKKCESLAQIPDLSGSPNLEFLDLRRCKRLKEVHSSVGSLEKLVHLNLQNCYKLERLPEKVNWRSLKDIILHQCIRLESFPEIVGEMKYMTSLSLYETGIKALPSSIGYLINLEILRLEGCGNLTDLPCSIYELQNLEKVILSGCPKFATFPNKVESEVLPTYSKVSHDNRDSLSKRNRWIPGSSLEPEPDTEFNSALPWLNQFIADGCTLSNIDFLASLDCASTLAYLDLSGSPIVILPECIINKFVNLRELYLSGCTRLVEIPELPPSIIWLDVRDCVSLERISKLSNILERKESQITIEEMDLTNCWRLCQNLVEMANKDDDELDADLFSRLLSSQQFKFTIRFPVPRSEVPKWFSCQMDFKGHRRFDFYIETLANFKWDNTGLALCVAADQKLQDVWTGLLVYIHINEVRVLTLGTQWVDSAESDHVWLGYVPFLEMWRFGYMRPLPPFTCRVIIYQDEESDSSIKSCGVHLVMPPNEDVCMKLIRAENLTSELSDDEVYLSDDEVYLTREPHQ